MAGSILILRGTSSAYDFIGGMLGLVAQEMEALGQRVVSFSTDELGGLAASPTCCSRSHLTSR